LTDHKTPIARYRGKGILSGCRKKKKSKEIEAHRAKGSNGGTFEGD